MPCGRMYAKIMYEKENGNDDVCGVELKKQGSKIMRQGLTGGKWLGHGIHVSILQGGDVR